MNIGDDLAHARHQAGLTITKISQQTRIRETIIRDIEHDDFHSCGGDFYARATFVASPVRMGRPRGADQRIRRLLRRHRTAMTRPQAVGGAASRMPGGHRSTCFLDNAVIWSWHCTPWDSHAAVVGVTPLVEWS